MSKDDPTEVDKISHLAEQVKDLIQRLKEAGSTLESPIEEGSGSSSQQKANAREEAKEPGGQPPAATGRQDSRIKAEPGEGETYRALFNAMTEGFALHEVVHDSGGKPYDYRFLEVNPAFEKITGLRSKDIIGRTIRSVLPNMESDWIRHYGEVAQNGRPVRFEIYARELERYFQVMAFTLRRGQFAALFVDVTASKKMEQELRKSESRYRSLVRNSVYGIYRSTLEGRFLDVNPALVALLGYDSEEELLGVNIDTEIYRNPGDRARYIKGVGESDRIDGVEVDWKRKDGTPITVRLSGRVVRNRAGGITSFEVMAENVTQRMQEAHARQEQRMEAIARLAGGIAHDFNNILTGILGYSDFLLANLPQDAVLRENALEIQKAGRRAAEVTGKLLAFSSKQALQPVVLDLNAVIKDNLNMLRHIVGKDVEVVVALDPALAPVKVDPDQIELVLHHLASNARDAMPTGGRFSIETANVVLDENYTRRHLNVHPGAYLMMSVTDNGVGMDAETQSRVFEPFFTTKGLARASGLGLSLVYGIIKQSGGSILLHSELGRGTTFKVFLPQSTEKVQQARARRSGAIALEGTETILLVEDDDVLRELARRLLREYGYTVLSARDAKQAEMLCREHPGTIELLLTDVVIPGSSGLKLFRVLSTLRPELKVLYTSGYSSDTLVEQEALAAGGAFLQKPFTTEILAWRVRQVLNPSADS